MIWMGMILGFDIWSCMCWMSALFFWFLLPSLGLKEIWWLWGCLIGNTSSGRWVGESTGAWFAGKV